MPKLMLLKISLGVIIIMGIIGCAPHKIYRTETTLCSSSSPENECKNHALQAYKNPEDPEKTYLLGLIEFDDQGQLFDRKQMRAVLDKLYGEAAKKDLLIIVFVHGWKHSAAPGDDNIKTFRNSLKRLSELESSISGLTEGRQVFGVYLGWRGGSVTAPVLKELTFWDRKNTAHKVGNGGVTEVLSQLDLVKITKDSMVGSSGSRTRLVVIGHSFGGAVVYSALSQILNDRFIHTAGPAGQSSDARGFGDLVVLINPAFEALLFTPQSDMSTERGSYFPSQLPVFAILTSESDYATKLAFPIGRGFSTIFEKEGTINRTNGVTGKQETIDEGKANITAVGHFEPYKTHELRATQTLEESAQKQASVQDAVQLFSKTSQSWENDAPGSEISFDGSILKRTEHSAGRNPYLVIQVDKELIGDHNDIDDERVASFIRQLILISSQGSDLKERQQKRSRVLNK
jgi:hypothetical protein